MTSNSTPFTLRWGILATGGIARQFVGDLLTDPTTRGIHDVVHKVVAVGSSSSREGAQTFIDTFVGTGTAKAYGSYLKVVQDAEVDIVYVGSPASLHYPNVLMALNANKHVCCEKPFTINAKQTEHLMRIARSKQLFLMEVMWSKFFPSIEPLLKILHSDPDDDQAVIGRPLRLLSDFSLQVDPRRTDPSRSRWDHRLFDPNLGGGALLDLGIYCIMWAILVFFKDPCNGGTMPTVTATMVKTEGKKGEPGWKGEVDNFTSVILTFERLGAVAILSTSLSVRTPSDGVVIQGQKGNVHIPQLPCRPEQFVIRRHGYEPETHDYRIPYGQGLHYEADACARAIRDGKLEAGQCSLDGSLVTMQIMDEIRKQGGLQFPDDVERVHMDG